MSKYKFRIIKSKIWNFSNKTRNYFRKRNLKNNNFSIFSSMCIGGIIYNNLGLRFLSPTINLWIKQPDFLEMICNLKKYMEMELKFIKTEYAYPVANLGNIKIYFNHYKSEEEAMRKWNDRKERINYENIFFIMIEREGITYGDIEKFDHLNCKNKVIFTCREYPEFPSAICIKRYIGQNEVGPILDKESIWGLRIIDHYFDPISWLNL